MTFSFRIRIIKAGLPVVGVAVTAEYQGFFSGIGSDFTDSEGWAKLHMDGNERIIQTLWVDEKVVDSPQEKVCDGDRLTCSIG